MTDRRSFMVGFVGLTALSLVAPTEVAAREGDFASRFLGDLLKVAGTGDVALVSEYLRERVDTQYAFDTAFAGIAAGDGQKRRLAQLMLMFLSREATMLAQMAQGGQIRVTGSKAVEDGTVVEVAYRDRHGFYPLFVLVGQGDQLGSNLVKDFGSSEQTSVVTKLAYATQSLQQVTPDASVWIKSFEQSLAEG